MAFLRKQHGLQSFDTTLIVAYCTLMGYLCAYVYELGYLTNFGVPWEFAQVTLPLIFTVVLIFLALCVWAMPGFFSDQVDQNKKMPRSLILLPFILLVLLVLGYLVLHDTSFIIFSIVTWLMLSLIGVVSRLDEQNSITIYSALAPSAFLLILLSFLLGAGIGDFTKSYLFLPAIHDNENDFVVVRVYGNQLLTMPVTKNGKLEKAVRLMNADWLADQQKTIELDAVKIRQ